MLMLVAVVVPSFLLFGYNNGVTGGIMGLESFVSQFPQIDTVNTEGALKAQASRVKGVVTGSYDLGAVFGSLSSIAYGDRIGRLRTVFVGLVLAIIALAIQASSYSLAQLVVGRILIGGSIGIISAAIPVWQSECSTQSHRGTFVIFEGMCIASGIALSEWIDLGFSFLPKSSGQWRAPIIFPAIFPIIVLPIILSMPESPRWLMSRGRIDEARRTLSALLDVPSNSDEVETELSKVQDSLERMGSNRSLLNLLKNGKDRLLHRTLLAMCGQMFQQMCGISALVFYTSTFFSEMGFEELNSRIIGCCLVTFQALCSVIPLFTVDRYGRRKLLMFSAVGLSISMAVIAGTGSGGKKVIAAVVFCFVYDFFFPIGFLGLTFLYAAELSPLAYRVPITAIANATQWMCQFLVAQVTPPGTTSLKNRYYIIYAVLNASFAVIVYFLFPETNGRSLEDMDMVFESTTNIFSTVSVSRDLFNKKTITDKSGAHQIVELEKSQAIVHEEDIDHNIV